MGLWIRFPRRRGMSAGAGMIIGMMKTEIWTLRFIKVQKFRDAATLAAAKNDNNQEESDDKS